MLPILTRLKFCNLVKCNSESYRLVIFFLYIYFVSCVDVDECNLDNGECDHTCTNTDGSFFCSCDAGYLLTEDGRICAGKWCVICIQDLLMKEGFCYGSSPNGVGY